MLERFLNEKIEGKLEKVEAKSKKVDNGNGKEDEKFYVVTISTNSIDYDLLKELDEDVYNILRVDEEKPIPFKSIDFGSNIKLNIPNMNVKFCTVDEEGYINNSDIEEDESLDDKDDTIWEEFHDIKIENFKININYNIPEYHFKLSIVNNKNGNFLFKGVGNKIIFSFFEGELLIEKEEFKKVQRTNSIFNDV